MAIKYLRACMTNFVKVSHFMAILRELDKPTCNQSFYLFTYFFLRLDFLRKMTAPAVHTLGLTLTVTATLILSLTVSLVSLHRRMFSA